MSQESSSPLSKRELQVLELLVTGATNKEIAHQLVISVNTVKVHVRNIFEKMGVQSRAEATLLAIQENIIDIADVSADEEDNSESSAPVTRTFLLEANPPQPLASWQQLYLGAAMLVAMLLIMIPLLPAESSRPLTSVPVIYSQPTVVAPAAVSDTSNNRWKNHALMPTKRAGLAVAAINDKIFAIGGVRDNNKATRSVEIFDTTTNSWQEGASKPTAATDIVGAVIDHEIYVPGGCTNQRQALDTLDIYEPASDSWRSGSPLPAARCGYGLAAFDGSLYLFGGWSGPDKEYSDTIFVYDPARDAWTILEQTLPQPMGYLGAAVLNDTIYLAGGFDDNNEYSDTYAFTPATNKWQQKSPLQEARGGLGLIAGGNALYAIGGAWQHTSANSEKYDPGSDSWSTFETPIEGQWRNLGLTTVDTAIYAVGGWDGDNEEYLDSLVSYQFLFTLFVPISGINQQPQLTPSPPAATSPTPQ